YYKKYDVFYYLRLSDLIVFYDRAKSGGRKSFKYEELDPSFFISKQNNLYIHYLEKIQLDLNLRD
ncbi:MAG TPA: Holliday junction resolvase RecU, partial [Clostridiales bacterium]|nr:Holliday junction resolvase RecU [Clostridiales bacterium]